MELWKENRVEMLDFRDIYIQTIDIMRSIKVVNHEKRNVDERQVYGCYLHLRGKRKKKKEEEKSENNLQTQKREGFCLFVTIRKRLLFPNELALVLGGILLFLFFVHRTRRILYYQP